MHLRSGLLGRLIPICFGLFCLFALSSHKFALAQTEPVNIPDARLRLLIEATLSKTPGATITRAEMQLIPFIVGTSLNIADLTGLEYATNMQQAVLNYNQIKDISPLAGLSNLTILQIEGNQISDLTPLTNLTNLTTLTIGGLGGGNLVSNISPLANLTNLTQLVLSSNMISNLSPLASLTALQNLTIDDNRISNLTPLANLTNLRILALGSARGGNSVSDISALSGLTSLTQLWLQDNSVSDISALSGLTSLTRLQLQDNSVSDISGLSGLTSLTRLHLQGNSITDISALVSNMGLGSGDQVDLRGNLLSQTSHQQISTLEARGVTVNSPIFASIPDANLAAAFSSSLDKGVGRGIVTAYDLSKLTVLEAPNAGIANLAGFQFAASLTRLHLDGNLISDLTLLATLPQLTELKLGGNKISDLTPLANLRQLTELELSGNQISELTPLATLPRLTELELSGNQISNLAPLDSIMTLIRLGLGDNYISDLAPLAELTRLFELDLADNRISDLAPLAGLAGLIGLDLGGNRISDLSPLVGLTELIKLDLGNNRISDATPLAGMNRLISLNLQSNHLSALAPLANLTELDDLQLNGNSISDIAPLLKNTGLDDGDQVDLHDNFLSDESNRIHLSALRDRGVSVVNDTAISVASKASALEGEDIEFRVSMSAAVEFDLNINWDVLTIDAEEVEDFASGDATGVLSINALDTEGIIAIRTTEDEQSEEDETFDLFINFPLGWNSPAGVELDRSFGTATILDDDRPIAQKAVPNQQLAAGSDAFELELSSLFSAPGKLMYEAISSDSILAKVRISGDRLIIRPEQAGMVTITITATDGAGFKAMQTFTVTVQPTAPRSRLRGWRLGLLTGDQEDQEPDP